MAQSKIRSLNSFQTGKIRRGECPPPARPARPPDLPVRVRPIDRAVLEVYEQHGRLPFLRVRGRMASAGSRVCLFELTAPDKLAEDV